MKNIVKFDFVVVNKQATSVKVGDKIKISESMNIKDKFSYRKVISAVEIEWIFPIIEFTLEGGVTSKRLKGDKVLCILSPEEQHFKLTLSFPLLEEKTEEDMPFYFWYLKESNYNIKDPQKEAWFLKKDHTPYTSEKTVFRDWTYYNVFC